VDGVKDITSAIDGGVSFLLSRRDARGSWSEFATLAGPSTEWASAYVAFALARTARPAAVQAARETWNRLRFSHWWSGGWGYHRRVPSDADSTVWVLSLGMALGARPSRRALRFLEKHVTTSGGVVTFASGLPIRVFTRVARGSFAGWCSPHPCVTAAAVSLPNLPHRARALAWLREAQRADGHWPAYWWASPHYATALAAEALAAENDASDGERVARAAAWTSAQVGARANAFTPFDSSLALRTLLLAPDADAERERLIEALLAGQGANQDWTPSARLRIPPPDMTDPDSCVQWKEGGLGGRSVQVDRGGCFTTASVLLALRAVEESASERPHPGHSTDTC
jgi:hypothetical protein